MKLSIRYLILFSIIFSEIGWATGKTVILLSTAENGECMGSLEKLLPEQYHNRQLNGQARKSPTSNQQEYLFQIAWTGLQDKTDPIKQIAFEKPMVSTFKTKQKSLKKGQSLPIVGDVEALLKAAQKLETEKTDVEALKRKQFAKNPSGKGRSVEVESFSALHSNHLAHTSQNRANASSHSPEEAANQNAANRETDFPSPLTRNLGRTNMGTDGASRLPGSTLNNNNPLNGSTPPLYGQVNANATYPEGERARNQNGRTDNVGAGPAQNLGVGNTHLNGSRSANLNSNNMPGNAATPSHFNDAMNAPRRENRDASIHAPTARTRPSRASPRIRGAAEAEDRQSGIFSQSPAAAPSFFTTTVGAGAYTIPRPIGLEGAQSPPAAPNPLADNPRAFDPVPERIAEIEPPQITYESTAEGCQPTIDRPHERVVIQNRTLKRENGAIVEESACADSLEMYPINKDFLCEGCTDQVEIPRQRAYARFKEYWLNKENHRENLSDALYVELTRPYVFSEEPGYCLPSINLQRGVAQRQVETVYYNLFNARTLVEACHTTPNHAPVLIHETTHLCPMVNDFANNVSRQQKRSIFTLDGIEREALACHPTDPAFPHEFVRTGCRPLVVAANGTFIDMVKRKIRTPTGSKIISEECEPAPNSALLATRDGCEGEFFHDLIAGFSYLKKRYYYPHGNNREYMTGCLRTTESLAHQTEPNGYQHDDENLQSTPRFLVYIEPEDQPRVVIEPFKLMTALEKINYTLFKNEHRPTAEQYFEGCYRRTRTQSINVYLRADGTLYERIIGAGNPVASTVDECVRTTESQQVVTGHRGGSFWRHSSTQYGTQYRTKITYPNGSVTYTGWQ